MNEEQEQLWLLGLSPEDDPHRVAARHVRELIFTNPRKDWCLVHDDYTEYCPYGCPSNEPENG